MEEPRVRAEALKQHPDKATSGVQQAFRLTADPAFFWRHGQYARAFDDLRAAVLAGERFAVLTGDAGTGKTTLANALGQSLRDDGVVVGQLMYGRLDAADMWSAVARALGMEGLESREAFTIAGRAAFCAVCAGAPAVVLIVDEAHTFSTGALIELERLAWVLSAGDRPVLSVLLVGLPELTARLESAECGGLAERVGTRVEIADLSAAEVASYIRHRLEIASVNPALLPADVVGRVATASGGTPARINQMCHALVAGLDAVPQPARGRTTALRGWLYDSLRSPTRIGLIAVGVAALAIAFIVGVHGRMTARPPVPVVAPAEPVAPSVDATAPPGTAEQPVSPSPPPSGPVAAPEPAPTPVDPSLAGQPAKPDIDTSVVTADTAPVPRKATRQSVSTPATRTAPPRATPPASAVKPQPQGEQPDPSDVIDWLLKERSGTR